MIQFYFVLFYFLIHFCAERNLSILDRYSVEFYFLIECSFCFFSIGEIKQASQEKVNLTFAQFVSSLIRLFNSFSLFVFPQDLTENQVSKSFTFLALKDAEVRKQVMICNTVLKVKREFMFCCILSPQNVKRQPLSKALLRVERKEGKRNLTSKSSHVTNTISGDERQCPVSGYQTEIIASSLYSLKE